jgi:nitroimidazol reductase NimA-like FMN-containing flavoprotein (pyridoxamine 5'-phosphate oxidase superfamily)
MKEVKNKIKRIIETMEYTRVRYSKKGFIVPIYYGYDSQGKLIFDVESMRDEFDSILTKFESGD